jgi:hypothetical protein
MLRSRGAAFAPDADTKARARQRLMEVLAAEQAGPDGRPGGPSLSSVPLPAAGELPMPMGRHAEPPAAASEETVRITPVTDLPTASTETADTEANDAGSSADAPTDVPGRPGHRAKHSVANRPAGRSRASQRPGHPSLRRRVMVVGAAALIAMTALAGGGVFASRDALPGDNLYAMKRAAESAELALALDDAAKARRQLEIAATRLSEVERLTAREGQSGPSPDAVAGALQDFESATGEGSRLLLSTAEAGDDRAAIDELHTWADKQATRLTELRPALPSAADADGPMRLLDRLLGRTEALSDRSSCGAASSGAVDDLGPLPTARACAPNPGRSGSANSGSATTTGPNGTREDAPRTGPGTGNTRDAESGESPSTPRETPEGGPPGLLSDLLPETTPPSTESSEDNDTDEGDSDEGDAGRSKGSSGSDLPLPLLPPINLPPLLPGMNGLTIG